MVKNEKSGLNTDVEPLKQSFGMKYEPRNITGLPGVSIMYVPGWGSMWAYDMLSQ